MRSPPMVIASWAAIIVHRRECNVPIDVDDGARRSRNHLCRRSGIGTRRRPMMGNYCGGRVVRRMAVVWLAAYGWDRWCGARHWRRRVTICIRGVVEPFVLTTTTSVHKKIANSRQVEAQLLRYCDLHLFRRSFCFFEYGLKCSPLQICEHQSRLLGCYRWLWNRRLLFFFPFAGCVSFSSLSSLVNCWREK